MTAAIVFAYLFLGFCWLGWEIHESVTTRKHQTIAWLWTHAPYRPVSTAKQLNVFLLWAIARGLLYAYGRILAWPYYLAWSNHRSLGLHRT